MGIFRDIAGFVSRPVRGLGRIVRGDVKKGLGDITGTAKSVAPFVPGVGWGVTAGLNVADRALKDQDISLGSMVKDVGGAYGSHQLGKMIRSRLGSGAPDGATLARTSPTVSLNTPDMVSVAGSGIGAPAVSSIPATAINGVPDVATKNLGSSIVSKLGIDGLSTAERWKLGLDAAGLGMQAYGAKQMGDIEQEQFDYQRGLVDDDRARDRALDPVRAAVLRAILARRAA